MEILMDGKTIAAQVLAELKDEALKLKVTPGLAVIMVGENAASDVYVRNKERACEKAGFYQKTYRLPDVTSEEEITTLIKKLGDDCNIHGIIVQLPLPKHISEEHILNAIPIDKDVDCFHPFNIGKLLTIKKGYSPISVVPCTPAGVMELLDRYKIPLSGKNIAVVGRSNIVGKPIALMLLNRNATVTICHSKTENIAGVLKRSDVVIAAVGSPKMIRKDMIKDYSTIIDVGVNRTPEGGVCGDVDFDDVKDKVYAITPVPGG
ncbi:MAG: bifunctional 5,10-methylenetetrahydrofolate dehydrogenase/5,10-methenyltetrahydrofolate cyclohydrolase, partial [Pseudomonadota bacterium]